MFLLVFCFFFNDTATTEIYTLSLHDALPIWRTASSAVRTARRSRRGSSHGGFRRDCLLQGPAASAGEAWGQERSEEHTSELQSRQYLVCRLLLEKKKNY